MTVTLAELQERYPIGSKWRVTALGPRAGIHEVLTYHDGRVILAQRHADPIARMPHILDGNWTRIPDPVPCPVTEALELVDIGDGTWHDGRCMDAGADVLVPCVTLHPPGTVLPADTPRGEYSWTETPS